MVASSNGTVKKTFSVLPSHTTATFNEGQGHLNRYEAISLVMFTIILNCKKPVCNTSQCKGFFSEITQTEFSPFKINHTQNEQNYNNYQSRKPQ